jgi:hypothetical protein
VRWRLRARRERFRRLALGKRQLAREHAVEHGARAEQIGRGTPQVHLRRQALGRHVRDGSDERAVAFVVADRARDAEVGEPELESFRTAAVEQQVRELHVEMEEPARVQRRECSRSPRKRSLSSSHGGQRAHAIEKAPVARKREREEGTTVRRRAEIVEPDHVRVRDARRERCLAFRAAP